MALLDFIGKYVPLLKFKKKLQLHEMLDEFRDRSGRRYPYKVDEAFVVESHAYATDGRAMARIESRDADTQDAEGQLPPALACWEDCWHERGSWLEPKTQLVAVRDEYTSCPQCGTDVTCDRCDGEGYNWNATFGHYDTCTKCNGHERMGRKDCPTCKGGPRDTFHGWQLIGDKFINIKLWRKISHIPGVEINLGIDNNPRQNETRGQTGPIMFRSPIGIQGLVCPVKFGKEPTILSVSNELPTLIGPND